MSDARDTGQPNSHPIHIQSTYRLVTSPPDAMLLVKVYLVSLRLAPVYQTHCV